MCGICRTVNCIRRRLFGGCGCNNNSYYNSNTYSYNGCANSRYAEPRTRITCANQQSRSFTPCCDDSDCCCHNHHDDCCD